MVSERKKAIHFHGLRIYLTSTIIFFLLVMPIALILYAKYGPDWLEYAKNGSNISDTTSVDTTMLDTIPKSVISSGSNINNDTIAINPTENLPGNNIEDDTRESRFLPTLSVLLKLLIISFLLGLLFNLPFKIYFKRLRKHKKIPEKLEKFCKHFLLKVPLINAGILFISFGGTLFYMLYNLIFTTASDEISQRFYFRFFIISLVSTVLTLLFVYFWEKHRVNLKYLAFVFNKEELKKRIFRGSAGKIRYRLWVSNAMTTLLPLFIVMFYLFLSITTVNELNINELDKNQLQILFGRYIAYFGSIEVSNYNDLFYVNVIDSILMFSGIFTGIFVSIVYLLFFVNWTTTGIVDPVNSLLLNMQATGRGELNQYGIVRTNDEIGELTEGYNDMSRKINDYIVSISRINEANARFVPRQFLDYLGKDNISDINLGDQIQKEMTVMFCDIRNFTGISEEMTPKENFNFLNNYLGYMEPVIRRNQGFIDKFIGDSIMALFSEKAEDAINAAIEMRIKLLEFNQVISQFGMSPIDNGIGIHSGNLMLGVVGGEGRMDGTVISDAVNLSSRLEGLTKLYGSSIIISEDTLIRINDPSHYSYRFLDIVKVKGKKEAVYIFEILDGEPEQSKRLKLKTKTDFGKGLQLYKNMQFSNALELFIKVISENPEDKAASLYIKRCKKIIKEGTPENWDGIEIIDNKFD